MSRSLAALVGAFVIASVFLLNPASASAAGEGPSVTSELTPWGINGSLMGEDRDTYAHVDVGTVCSAEHNEIMDGHRKEHEKVRDDAEAEWERNKRANELAIRFGDEPPYPAFPPLSTLTKERHVLNQYDARGWPYDAEAHARAEWIQPLPETSDGVPCEGVDGLLPYPTEPGIIIPPPTRACDDPTVVPFAPAKWEWVPEWHPKRSWPDTNSSGFWRVYSPDGVIEIPFFPFDLTVVIAYYCIDIWQEVNVLASYVDDELPPPQLAINPSGPGITGLDTWLWYDFDANAPVVEISTTVPHIGTDWTFVGKAWVSDVGWDLDYRGGDPIRDVWVNLSDDEWNPADDYVSGGGSEESPAGIHVYETKDFYDIATILTWRGYYTITRIGGEETSHTVQYKPVDAFEVFPYQVDEIVSRKSG